MSSIVDYGNPWEWKWKEIKTRSSHPLTGTRMLIAAFSQQQRFASSLVVPHQCHR
jgi:hypothetical protein